MIYYSYTLLYIIYGSVKHRNVLAMLTFVTLRGFANIVVVGKVFVLVLIDIIFNLLDLDPTTLHGHGLQSLILQSYVTELLMSCWRQLLLHLSIGSSSSSTQSSRLLSSFAVDCFVAFLPPSLPLPRD